MSILNTSCDVLVIGAGVSGVPAALASARSRADTVLVEKNNFLGGAGYSGLFQYICGLYANGDSLPAATINEGIVREITDCLNHLSPHKTVKKTGRVYVLPYNREDLRSVFDTLCSREEKLTVINNTTVIAVEKENGEIAGVTLNHNGALSCITPGIVIDCSGSGIISEMAGAAFELSRPEKIQLAGYIIRFKGMSDLDETLPIKVPYYLSEAAEKKILPGYLRFSVFSPGDDKDEGYCKLSINDSGSSNERDTRAREYSKAVHRCLADKLPSFKDSYIAGTSLGVMDREGRRVCGEYTLTGRDVLNAGKFHDGVVKNSWPIEIWDKNRGTIYKYLRSGEYYEIPLRCLKVKGISNLLCAGRCISVTQEALGSTRVMGTCISLGEQAGLAAASYVKQGRFKDHRQ